MSDVTAFLESQKDWDLERDNGWTGVEVLFILDNPKHKRPTYKVPWMFDEERVVLDLDNDPVKDYRDIPLTLSSEVEGALLEAIRRLDLRITTFDLWARLSVHSFRSAIQQGLTSNRPKHCKKGNILTPEALNLRMGRFRLENAVVAWRKRKGSESLRKFLWDRMSPAARAAKSTRELKKLSKEEQEQAQEGNAGKHAANAGGWAKTQQQAEEGVSARANAEEEGAGISALGSHDNERAQRTFEAGFHDKEACQPPSIASEQGGGMHSNKRRKVRESAPSTSYALQNSHPEAMYGDPFSYPFLHSQSATHDYDRPFGSSSGFYDILPTEVAFRASNENPWFVPDPNGETLSAGFGITYPMGAQANPWHDSQYILPAAQHQETRPSIGFEGTLDNIGLLASPWHDSQHTLPAAHLQSTHWPLGVEGTSNNPFGANCAQNRSSEGDVEAYFLSTSLRSLANQTHPTESSSSGEVDYRDIVPRTREEEEHIQRALVVTRDNCRLRTGIACPPTARDQSYSYQLNELLDSFAVHWAALGNSSLTPDIMRSREPWKNGFKSWVACTGGDKDFVLGQFRGAHSY